MSANGASDDLSGEAIRVSLLGGFSVVVGPRTISASEWPRRPAALFKLLAMTPRHTLHRDEVVECLWPAMAAEDGVHNLHQALSSARRVLEPALKLPADSRYLRLEDDWLRLCAPSLWVDVDAFEDSYRDTSTDDLQACTTAARLYTGDLLPDDRYEDWPVARRERLRGEYRAVLRRLARLHEERGEPAAAMQTLEALIAADPIDEDGHTALMRLFARAGS